ncbi:response regulator transcription factor [Saprospiraceae bacterium]|nr:response regulator transcription factor [Saprospiraceae bacterium]
MENNTNIKPIKVAIIEDLKDVALELQSMFNDEADMSCTQVYHNAEDAIQFLGQFPADVVLVDIGLPRLNGISAIVSIREQCPETQFCMFTVFEDNDKIFKSLQAGAKGYILKNSDPDLVLRSIRELAYGGSPMNPEIARKVINAFALVKPEKLKNSSLPLTERELQLLDLLSQGLLYKEIGQNLGITTGTVKQHIHKIYGKLQVNNRTEAINKYLNRD